MLESLDARPEASATLALTHVCSADFQRLQFYFAPRTIARIFILEQLRVCSCSTAMSTEFTSKKHEPETRRAADSLQSRLTEFALRTIALDRRTAVRTI